MKLNFEIGKIKFAFNEKKSIKSGEIGSTGTTIWNGMIQEHYNPNLQGRKKFETYEQMRKSDAQIQAALLALELPLRSAKWYVEPPSDADKTEEEAAEFIEDALFNRMSITFDDFLNHILLYYSFGFMIFEKVYKIEDDKIYWKKLAPRLPKTLYKWNLDEEGGLKGITQYALKGNSYGYFEIPVEDLIVFTRKREGSNYEGKAILEPIYKHWYFKDVFLKIAAIGLERQAVGVPVGKYPKNATDEAKAALENLVSKLQVNEQVGIVLPPDFDISILEGKLKSAELLEHINYQDAQIAQSILAPFLKLGQQGQGGSYALSKDQSDFFMMILMAEANYICDTVNRYAIKDLIDKNFSSVTRYPKLKVKLDELNIDKIVEGISRLAEKQVIIPDEDLETFVRNLLTLPPIKTSKVSASERKPRGIVKLAENGYGRDFTKWEKSIKFKELDNRFNDAEEEFKDELGQIINKQTDNIISQVNAVLVSGKLDDLSKVTAGYKGKYSATIKRIMRDLAEYGRDMVVAEHSLSPVTIPNSLTQWLNAKGETIANLHGVELESKSILAALNSINAGKSNKAIIFDVQEKIKEWAEKSLTATASITVEEAVNEGRQATAYTSKMFQAAQFSAILDGGTCPLCKRLDGQIISLNNPDYEKFTPPLHIGRVSCRCIWVYINKEEENVDITWINPGSDLTEEYGSNVASERLGGNKCHTHQITYQTE